MSSTRFVGALTYLQSRGKSHCAVLLVFLNSQNQLSWYELARWKWPNWSDTAGPTGAASTQTNAPYWHTNGLSIVDVEHGAQPLLDATAGRALAVNGEIYNHVALREKLKRSHAWKTKSDCEIILYLYDEYGPALCNMLSGIFAFALYDERAQDFFVARDHIGIIPLYIGWGRDGATYVASEMKALDAVCETIEEFPPGHYYYGREKRFVRWYDPEWAHTLPTAQVSLPRLRNSLETAVKQQLMCDVPYGVLISGGLDSSLIAALAARHRLKRIEFGRN